jgi:hypothetical protein
MTSAFVDCVVCRRRAIERFADGLTDQQLMRIWRGRGWRFTIMPLCPDHALAAGRKRIEKARASLAECELAHDPEPWLFYAGLASGGGQVFNGGGAEIGRARLGPREGYCRDRTHYWRFERYDELMKEAARGTTTPA